MKKILIIFVLFSSLTFAGENIWTPTALYGRCCQSFVFDPFRPNVIFGIGPGEIYKSTTSGKTWKRVTFPFQDQSTVVVLRISGQNPSKIFVISKPDFFRSIDDGRTWQKVGSIRFLNSVSDMEIDSKDPDLIYVGGGIFLQGARPVVFRSKDGGKIWKQVLLAPEGATMQIEVHPTLRGVVYARDSKQIFKSTNAGETWIQNDSIPNGTFDFKIDPVNGNTLYTAAGDVFKSTDNGNTWSGLRTHLDYTISIAIDRNNPQTIYAAGSDDVLKSSNDGESWNTLKLAPSLNFYNPWTIAVSPHRSNLLLGWIINGSPYRSLNAGQSFDLITTGGSGQVDRVLTFKKNPSKLLAVGNALFHTTDFGKSWIATDFPVPDANTVSVVDMQVHPADENLVLAIITNTSRTFTDVHYLAKSLDGGHTWNLLPINLDRIVDMGVDPVNPNTIYVAGFHKAVKTIDGGSTWMVLAEKISPKRFSSIDVDPFNPNRVFICTEGSRIFRSVDGGLTWKNSDNGITPDRSFNFRTAFDPFKPDNLFAFDIASVYKSTNGGQSWSRSGTGLNLNPMKERVLTSLTPHPAQKDVFFVTAIVENYPAVFISLNGGTHWEPFTDSGLSKNIFEVWWQLAASSDNIHYFLATDDGLYSMTQR